MERIIYDFVNIVEESRLEDRQDYYIKLRNTLDLLEKLIKENKKLNNMYRKEYDEHFEMKRQNEVLRNNERILRDENEQLKVNEEILMKTKGCLNEDNSTNCRVLESLNYGIRAYEKTLKNSIPISVIQNKKSEIEKQLQEYEESDMEQDDDYFFDVNAFKGEIAVLDEILEKGNK